MNKATLIVPIPGNTPGVAPLTGDSKLALHRLMRTTVLAAVTAVGGDLAIYSVGVAGWGVPGEFTMLNPLAIIVAGTLGVGIASLGFKVFARLTRRATAVFVAALVPVTLLSLLAPIQAMAGTMPGAPAATRATGISMIAMHLFTAGVVCWLLPRSARKENAA